METTDYCSYELSKALKAAGFDEPCEYYYTSKGRRVFNKNKPPYANNRFLDEIGNEICSAVPLWQAQKWLREKGIAVSIQANEIKGELWYSADIITTKGVNELVDGGFDYMGYEAALSAGISASLELIKKGE